MLSLLKHVPSSLVGVNPSSGNLLSICKHTFIACDPKRRTSSRQNHITDQLTPSIRKTHSKMTAPKLFRCDQLTPFHLPSDLSLNTIHHT